MDKVTLFEEYRLIERNEALINTTWKGAHLLLFFMAFVFGSFCTFNFHMLMYLFDKKCVLFPKLITLSSLPHDIIYEFIPVEKEVIKMLPVDFVSTQWMEKSVCYLPTYVPLMSCIFGIIWTTIFLVCYTGNRALAGSSRPWRVLPPIFVFSVAMSGVCIYSSTITYKGLDELCIKLGEITGSATCSYTVNVATLAYERSIRGVYQAIQLTNFSSWLHTSCWILSAILVFVRVLLAVDFQLVKVKAELRGDIDMMLEQYEEHMRTVSPNSWPTDEDDHKSLSSTPKVVGHSFINTKYGEHPKSDLHFVDESPKCETVESQPSLVPQEEKKLQLREHIPPKNRHVGLLLLEVLDNVFPDIDNDIDNDKTPYSIAFTTSSDESDILCRSFKITRQYGQATITPKHSDDELFLFDGHSQATNKEIENLDDIPEPPTLEPKEPQPSTSQGPIASDKKMTKSNLKISTIDGPKKSDKTAKVQILSSTSTDSITSKDKASTSKKKVKKD